MEVGVSTSIQNGDVSFGVLAGLEGISSIAGEVLDKRSRRDLEKLKDGICVVAASDATSNGKVQFGVIREGLERVSVDGVFDEMTKSKDLTANDRRKEAQF